MSKRVLVSVLLTFALALSACERKGVKAPEELAPLTDTEAQALGTELAVALNNCDQAVLHRLFDMDGMLRAVVHKSGTSKEEQRGLYEGMKENASDLPQQFCAGSEKGNLMHFLRVHKRAGKLTLLFRTLANESLNYLEFYPGRAANGRARVNDVYVYMNGQTLVESLAQMIDVLVGNDSLMPAIMRLGDALNEDPAGALMQFEALPKKVQNTKAMQMIKLQAASAVDDDTYDKAIAGFEALFPKDPALDLVSIDGFIVRKNYEAALKAVDRLDANLGGDPHLDTIRISLLIEGHTDLERATELAEKRVQEHPESEDDHYLLLGAHVASHNFAGAVAIMKLMGERFDVVFEEAGLVPGDPDYDALKASNEWQAYVANTGG